MKFTPGIMAVSKVSLPAWLPMASAAIDLDFVNQRYYWGGAEKTTANFTTFVLGSSTIDSVGLTPNTGIDITLLLAGLGTFTPGAYACAMYHSSLPAQARACFTLSDGTNVERVQLNQGASGGYNNWIIDDDVLQGNPGIIAAALNVKHGFASSYALNSITTSANGATGTADTAATMPTVSILHVGRGPILSLLMTGSIARLAWFTTTKTQAELNILSASMQASNVTLTSVNLAGQTRFGDMTVAGGVDSVFDGVTNQASASCAQKSITNVTNGFVGTRLPAAKRIGQVRVYGTNNNGFCVVNPNITLRVYGKSGTAPANSTDGVILATETFLDSANESAGRIYNITDTNLYDWLWVWITQDTATTRICAIAEMEVLELV